ncbi:glycoside hydrolase [Mycobacterium sp. TY815]|uniref:glycoside hydrolase family 2 protein n=1 Tax=Mycobacterium sp. TY815 TaxID=3050581 RepID=UPI002741F129|nr:glycoside hydrolase [Mycobacterium sp. TY815]MDP7701124.1 glycoside hydrolase [Mycobacterium sp. TY815]
MKVAVKIFIVLAMSSLSLCAAAYSPVATHALSAAPDRLELSNNWTLSPATTTSLNGDALSVTGYDATAWYKVARMPATVLEILRENGVYRDLYVGKNLRDHVPQDLYLQDWWYRTEFTAPPGRTTYVLAFPGINYRGEIWLNGHRVADRTHIVGMYVTHELDVTRWIRPGQSNVLAVKVTPERALQDVDGVELADSWNDWINWDYLGLPSPNNDPDRRGTSFVADRNAGIWKPVYLKSLGTVGIGTAAVGSELPLPRTDSARLTIRAGVHNYSAGRARGVLRATITRPDKSTIHVEQAVTLGPGEDREITLTPDEFGQLNVQRPDLWWPYTMGRPTLHDLRLEFRVDNRPSDSKDLRFGIRTVAQHRDEGFSGDGGDFYLDVNGEHFPIRGAAYTPDLLYRYDPDRETAILQYARDLGLNMLRLEGKLASEHLVEKADELGIPLMAGWMCCNQWEKWEQWDHEDDRVAMASLRSQIEVLRSHASAFIWANGSDGLPPPDIRSRYRAILAELHWQNATVDTASLQARDGDGVAQWDGIDMTGPYTWRPPSYWFSLRYGATWGASAEQGSNEQIPPFASLRRFIPADQLWPINDTWYFHAGGQPKNGALLSAQRSIGLRYGPSDSAEMFSAKAQLAQYESARAQFEAFAATGWDRHKMTIYWMLNSHWPSFFGQLFDYYLRPGGAYFGAKKGLRPLSVVFDSYAGGNGSPARISVVNQTRHDEHGLLVRVRIYDLQGTLQADRISKRTNVSAGGATEAMTVPRGLATSPVFFVRAQLARETGEVLAENVYWQSQQPDDVGDPDNDRAFDSMQASWADLTALNDMPRVPLDVTARPAGGGVVVRLHNPTPNVAFFERAEILSSRDGDEMLPVEYDDNYVTVFPGETVEIRGTAADQGSPARWVRVTGHNTPAVTVPVA